MEIEEMGFNPEDEMTPECVIELGWNIASDTPRNVSKTIDELTQSAYLIQAIIQHAQEGEPLMMNDEAIRLLKATAGYLQGHSVVLFESLNVETAN